MTRGIFLEGKKEATLLVWTIRKLDPPKRVRILLNFSKNNVSAPCINIGDKVKVGDLLAKPVNQDSVTIHSSVSGTISSLANFVHTEGYCVSGVEIETDSQEQRLETMGVERKGWGQLGRDALLEIFQNSGLVDLDAQMLPLHSQAAEKSEHLVINACEAEPYQTCEHALMMSHPLEILRGVELLRKAVDANRVTIVLQDNKLEVAETLKSKIYFLKWQQFEIQIIPSLYPQGRTEMLRKRFGADARILNVASAYAVYEAVALQKPFFERVLTVAGECLIEPKNIWARMGIDLETVVKSAKGFLRAPQKLLVGGPMRGVAQENLQANIIPGSQMVLALPAELTKNQPEEPCIRCGLCVEHCPEDLHPAFITLAAEQDLFHVSRDYGAQQCIECGNCSYVCPSKRPMVELIRYSLGKERLPKKKTKRSYRQWLFGRGK